MLRAYSAGEKSLFLQQRVSDSAMMVAVAERGERVTGQWTSDLRPADSTRCHNCTGVPWNGIGCGGVLLPQSL